MIVKMPDEEKYIDEKILDVVTRPAKKDTPEQTVRSILGKTVGMVPANHGRLFKGLLQMGDIRRITCISLRKPTISTKPPSHQSFQRNGRGGKDRRGGGAIIPCQYRLYCRSSVSYERVHAYVVSSLKELEMHDGTEKVLGLEKEDMKDKE